MATLYTFVCTESGKLTWRRGSSLFTRALEDGSVKKWILPILNNDEECKIIGNLALPLICQTQKSR
ncbi:hypothetical protein EV691_12269 [Azotobacter chroococcum]|uniref:Uncharacterized protein n=1 Tax=Azotobacter chroococcum TaxID=353 RepID=A0A4R1PMK9_9GAMM|nr:hypothetical protein EV691_12269 [Azotobacter chroococcum]